MIRIENLSKSYGGDLLFEKASLCINPGEKCGLIGRNGSGKTTLFRLLAGKESSDGGAILIPKQYSFGYLDQHIFFTHETILSEAIHSLPAEERDDGYKAEKILFGLGFQQRDMSRHPQEFSGGYQLRLHLARVLLSAPDCLLLDEPTNYLDIVATRWFTRFLKEWRGECIVISHDRDFLDAVTTHTIGIHRKEIVKTLGNTGQFFELMMQHEEVYEQTRVKAEKKRAHAEDFIKRFGAKATKASQAQSRKKALDKMATLEKLVASHDLQFSFSEAPFPGKQMLSADNITFSYADMVDIAPDRDLIENLSLSVEKGERIAVLGKNGRGKSTILKLLAGEMSPKKGSVTVSENIRMGYFGQTNITRLDDSLSVEEEISSANRSMPFGDVRAICGRMMFSGDAAKKKIALLSGGEKSRVLLGKIIAQPCNILLLDEPTNHLDVESIESLVEALNHFQGSFIVVTHSEAILRRLEFHKLVICRHGEQKLFLGNYDDFLEKIGWETDAPSHRKNAHSREKKQHGKNSKNRSPALTALKKEIASTEHAIVAIAEAIEKDNEKLVIASQKGNGEQIALISKSLIERRTQEEQLFNQLEMLSAAYEAENRD